MWPITLSIVGILYKPDAGQEEVGLWVTQLSSKLLHYKQLLTWYNRKIFLRPTGFKISHSTSCSIDVAKLKFLCLMHSETKLKNWSLE